MNDITLYMVTHKTVNFVPVGRTPIFVGKGNNSQNFLQDNTGDNISIKNINYCELTALYWIWKNDKKSKFVSLEHYRRFFMPENSFIPKIIDPKELKRYLNNNDVVTTKLFYKGISVQEYYENTHIKSDLLEVRNSIKTICPEYIRTFDESLEQHGTAMLNMMALSKELFDEYCSWLFTILFDVEKHISINRRDSYQQRVYGFLSEIMLDMWISHNRLRTKRIPVFYLDERSMLLSKLRTFKRDHR